ncbi:hypothetical protein SK066_13600 [Paenibacillus hunanensis]|uniref:hypothetical protein n=1 Tax=Paenibacillus hunanensis TaxID=539262 RepID=UPI002A6AE5D1|nr:hypothetical protein [Paenibacillus hunanensis]WPP39658.1 hypothetical protein SK066_13600 [Paenibacillus hunanensis]
MKPAIQEAMHNQTPLHVHLISGETYIGICKTHDNPNFFIIHTDCGDLTFPYWTIKRIKTAVTH